MTEPETVEVHECASPRRAPVELLGRVFRHQPTWTLLVDTASTLQPGDVLLASPQDIVLPSLRHLRHWRTGRAVVDTDGFVNLHAITAICEGDYIYRVGRPPTPSLEERVAELEYEMARRRLP